MIDICDVCNTLSSNCKHYDSMIICDVCEDFEGCSNANDYDAEFDEENYDEFEND